MSMKSRYMLALLPLATLNPDAQLPVDENARFSIGLNANYMHDAYATDNKVRVLPQAFYDNNRWYIEGSEAGFYPYKDRNNHLRVGISYQGREFDPSDAKDALAELDKRKSSVAAHASYMRLTPYGGVKVKVTTDALGHHKGQTATLSYIGRFSVDNTTVYPSVGATWYSKNYNQYYYGVSADESARSGVATYNAGSGIAPFVSLNANHQLTDHISIFGSARAEWLSGEQKNSPLTDGALSTQTRLGVNYRF